MTLSIILQTLLNSLQYAAVLSLSSFAIILIFKTSTTTNFAQGTISVLGGYFIATVLYNYAQLPTLLALLFGMVFSFAIGFLIDTQIFRRSRHLTGIGKQMITMGIVLVVTNVIPFVFPRVNLFLPKLMLGNLLFTIDNFTYSLSYHALFSIILAATILSGLFVALKYTKWGLVVRATASSELVAGMMGVNTRVITALSWSIAGALGALAAYLWGAASNGALDPAYMTNIQVNGFLSSILGGFGTFYGPVVGSVLYTLTNNLVGFPAELTQWKDVIVYALILLVILVRPIGLFGKKTIKKV